MIIRKSIWLSEGTCHIQCIFLAEQIYASID